MDLSILAQYSNEMPEEIRFLLKGLSDEKNLGVLIALLKDGKMTFNEMKKKFQLSSSSLTNRLNELQDGNLIKNFYEKSGKRGFSYYDVTDIPELIFDSLFDIMYPRFGKKELKLEETTRINLERERTKFTQFESQEKEQFEEKPEPTKVSTSTQKIRPFRFRKLIEFEQPVNATGG